MVVSTQTKLQREPWDVEAFKKSLILLQRLLIRLKHITGASKAGAIKHSGALFLGKELFWPLYCIIQIKQVGRGKILLCLIWH